METLNLKDVNFELYKINASKRREVYFNEDFNTLIIFNPHDKECNTESICNGISSEAYQYLIEDLNAAEPIIVEWSQVEGTTSDYTIYHDINPKDLLGLNANSMLKILDKAVTNERIPNYKYTEVFAGVESVVSF